MTEVAEPEPIRQWREAEAARLAAERAAERAAEAERRAELRRLQEIADACKSGLRCLDQKGHHVARKSGRKLGHMNKDTRRRRQW